MRSKEKPYRKKSKKRSYRKKRTYRKRKTYRKKRTYRNKSKILVGGSWLFSKAESAPAAAQEPAAAQQPAAAQEPAAAQQPAAAAAGGSPHDLSEMLEGSVHDVRDALQRRRLARSEIDALILLEKAGKNRRGIIRYLKAFFSSAIPERDPSPQRPQLPEPQRPEQPHEQRQPLRPEQRPEQPQLPQRPQRPEQPHEQRQPLREQRQRPPQHSPKASAAGGSHSRVRSSEFAIASALVDSGSNFINPHLQEGLRALEEAEISEGGGKVDEAIVFYETAAGHIQTYLNEHGSQEDILVHLNKLKDHLLSLKGKTASGWLARPAPGTPGGGVMGAGGWSLPSIFGSGVDPVPSGVPGAGLGKHLSPVGQQRYASAISSGREMPGRVAPGSHSYMAEDTDAWSSAAANQQLMTDKQKLLAAKTIQEREEIQLEITLREQNDDFDRWFSAVAAPVAAAGWGMAETVKRIPGSGILIGEAHLNDAQNLLMMPSKQAMDKLAYEEKILQCNEIINMRDRMVAIKGDELLGDLDMPFMLKPDADCSWRWKAASTLSSMVQSAASVLPTVLSATGTVASTIIAMKKQSETKGEVVLSVECGEGGRALTKDGVVKINQDVCFEEIEFKDSCQAADWLTLRVSNEYAWADFMGEAHKAEKYLGVVAEQNSAMEQQALWIEAAAVAEANKSVAQLPSTPQTALEPASTAQSQAAKMEEATIKDEIRTAMKAGTNYQDFSTSDKGWFFRPPGSIGSSDPELRTLWDEIEGEDDFI